MNTSEVANRLVELCRQEKNVDAINELYSDNVLSREPKGTCLEVSESKVAVLDKTNKWFDSIETIHSYVISGPLVSGDFFTIAMDIDATYKEHGRRVMNEIGVYHVRDGMIVDESFHYDIVQVLT